MKIRLLNFVLVSALLLFTFGCDGSQEASQTASDSVSAAESDKGYDAGLPDNLDYGGEQFIVLSSYGGDTSTVVNPFFGGNGEYEATVVNEAVLERNSRTEEALGVVIVEEMMTDSNRYGGGSLAQKVRTESDGCALSFQLVSASLYNCASLSVAGYTADMMKIEYLHELSGQWWNQSFITDTSIANRVYYAVGDISMGHVAGVFCLMFNKTVLANLGLDSPYQLVYDGTWDYDTFITMGQKMCSNTNDDGRYTYLDDIGIVGQGSMLWALLYSSGERIASINSDGYPELTINSERSVDLITTAVDYLSDRSHLCSGDDYFSETNTPMVLIEENFAMGKSLFYGTSIGTFSTFVGTVEDDCGVLPYPKYDLEQDDYYSLISPWTGNAVFIPFGLDTQTETMTGAVVEMMGAEGKNGATGAYCETMLKDQKTRDDDSRAMLDLIIKTSGCDLGQIFQLGKFSTTLQSMMANGDSDFISKYDSAKAAAQAAIDEMIAAFADR